MHAIQQCLRGLRTIKIVRVLRAPRIELDTLPARGQVLVNDGQRLLQLSTPEHVHVLATPAVRVRSEDPASEHSSHVFEGLDVASVHADLKGRLLAVSGERPFADDEPHGIPE